MLEAALHTLEKVHRLRATAIRYSLKVTVDHVEGMPETTQYDYIVVVSRKENDSYETYPQMVEGDVVQWAQPGQEDRVTFRFLIKFYNVHGVEGDPNAGIQRKTINFTLRQIPRSKSALAAGEKPWDVGKACVDISSMQSAYRVPFEINGGNNSGSVWLVVKMHFVCMEINPVTIAQASKFEHIGRSKTPTDLVSYFSAKSASLDGGRHSSGDRRDGHTSPRYLSPPASPKLAGAPPADKAAVAQTRKRYDKLKIPFLKIPLGIRNEYTTKFRHSDKLLQGKRTVTTHQLQTIVLLLNDIEERLPQWQAQASRTQSPMPPPQGVEEMMQPQEGGPTPQGKATTSADFKHSKRKEAEELREKIRRIHAKEEGRSTCNGCQVCKIS